MRFDSQTTLYPKDDTAVSPVIGSILMLVIVFLLMSIASTVVLSQYDTAPDPPDARVNFDQTVESEIEQTSRISITAIELYNSQNVKIQPVNSSINYHDETTGGYYEYRDETTGTLVSPDDAAYNPNKAQLNESGDKLRIRNASDKTQLQVIAQNDFGKQIISKYTVRYYDPPNKLTNPQLTL